jgi:hypothetical protein
MEHLVAQASGLACNQMAVWDIYSILSVKTLILAYPKVPCMLRCANPWADAVPLMTLMESHWNGHLGFFKTHK